MGIIENNRVSSRLHSVALDFLTTKGSSRKRHAMQSISMRAKPANKLLVTCRTDTASSRRKHNGGLSREAIHPLCASMLPFNAVSFVYRTLAFQSRVSMTRLAASFSASLPRQI